MEQYIGRTCPDGTREEKTVVELTEEEARGYELLGEATGVSSAHCFSLGGAHKENFWERVYGYRIVHDEMRDLFTECMKMIGKDEAYVTVRFYEKRA